jgi:hypothetical protein
MSKHAKESDWGACADELVSASTKAFAAARQVEEAAYKLNPKQDTTSAFAIAGLLAISSFIRHGALKVQKVKESVRQQQEARHDHLPDPRA